MEIINSTPTDIDAIFDLYDAAIAFQKTKFNKHWQGFDRYLVETEIAENRQYKIIDNEKIACIFAITFEDELIWKEKNIDSAVYIHRIVTNPEYRGQSFVKLIIEWAKSFCKIHNLDFIRMDTWADNEMLIAYYQKCGFNFLGITPMENTADLPKHYEGQSLSLFEIKV